MKYIRPFILICTLILAAPVLLAAGSAPQVGTAAEAIEAGSYIYIKLKEQDMWIAATKFPVSEGDTVQYSGASEMRDFYSQSLDRKFDSVFFVQNASLVSEEARKAHTPMATMGGSTMPPKSSPPQAPAPGDIAPLNGGKTIAEIIDESTGLEGHEVKLNAKIMKVSKHILGKNWITLRDGTGTKLVATSQEVPVKGEVVTATGIVRTNIDIGSGYQYEVLLEEATFSTLPE